MYDANGCNNEDKINFRFASPKQLRRITNKFYYTIPSLPIPCSLFFLVSSFSSIFLFRSSSPLATMCTFVLLLLPYFVFLFWVCFRVGSHAGDPPLWAISLFCEALQLLVVFDFSREHDSMPGFRPRAKMLAVGKLFFLQTTTHQYVKAVVCLSDQHTPSSTRSSGGSPQSSILSSSKSTGSTSF